MSDIVLPPSAITPNSPVVPVGVPGTVTNPPPEVARLTTGTVIRGVVVGQDDKGQLLIRTDSTTLTVATKAQLPVGTEVTLQVRSSGAQLQVIIVRVEAQANQAPQPVSGQQDSGSTAPRRNATPIPATPGSGATPDQLSLGHTIKAVIQTSVPKLPSELPLIGGAPAALAAPGQETRVPAKLTGLTPGTVLQLRIVAITAAPQPGTANPNPATIQPTSTGQINTAIPASQAIPGQAIPVQTALGAAQPSPAAPTAGLGQAAATGPPGQISAPQGVVPAQATAPPSQGGLGAATASSTPGSTITVPASTNLTLAQVQQPESPQAQNTGPTLPPGQGAPAIPGTGSGGFNQPAVPATAFPSAAEIVQTDSGLRFPGVVTSVTKAGQLVVQTPLGTMTLDAQATLPLGSRVMLELPAGTLMPQPLALSSNALDSPSTLTKIWPALNELVHSVQGLDSPLAAGALAPQIIPHLGPKMASGILFFLTALNGGNLEAWLGTPVLQALERAGYSSLVGRLARDLGQMARFAETSAGDWRLLLIPFLADDHLQQMRLFLRRHGDQGGSGQDDRPDEATRFILEVELSRIGDMQLDGLVRAKRFDLILRTRHPLPENMRNDIAAIFDDANQSAGYQGSIGFQASFDWHFMPIDPTPETSSSGLVV